VDRQGEVVVVAVAAMVTVEVVLHTATSQSGWISKIMSISYSTWLLVCLLLYVVQYSIFVTVVY